jgi:hypothetical protein
MTTEQATVINSVFGVFLVEAATRRGAVFVGVTLSQGERGKAERTGGGKAGLIGREMIRYGIVVKGTGKNYRPGSG